MSDTADRIDTVLDDPYVALEPDEQRVVDSVEEYGFHTLTIMQSEQDALDRPDWRHVPIWTYTIGFFVSYGHPEVVVFTLDEEIVRPLLWDLARAIEAGRKLRPGTVYEGLLPSFEGQSCAFEQTASGWVPELFGYADWFYKGQDFPVLQYLWPDRQGRFVWDALVVDRVAAAQPDLRAEPPVAGAPPPSRR